ncbi:dioxygenase family protein [Horticoccus sp. 23ND18S-11]|uniref:dioxygenase family protein n=1 Tax=Horticoccus sp. 23ND18S-11 TaxID=3391832 RepID=UPI0039C99E0E
MKSMSRSDSVRLFASTCLVSLALGSAAAAPVRTAEVTEGPFYPFNSTNTLPTITPANRDNDMTRVTGAATPARGLPFLLSGVVRDPAGAPVAGVKVELWQTDEGGVYYHSGDNNAAKRDPAFQHYGESVTDQNGRYSFRTIKPGLYTGRIRHFHFKVKNQGATVLTSQFTFDDERADFAKDGVQRRLSGDALESTVIAPKRGTDASGADAWVAVKDIVIDPKANTGKSADNAGPAGAKTKKARAN